MEVNINLSTEQSAIVKDLIHDIKLPTPTIHVVVGNAGTGKTTLLNVLQNKMPKDIRCIFCAPTHKACKVLHDKGINKVCTAHHLFMDPPGSEEETEFCPKEEFLEAYDCIIVDEASMLAPTMLDAIEQYATMIRCHIVFVGDNFQLPPVTSKKDAGEDVFARAITRGWKIHRLTKVFRQSEGSEILSLATAIREKQIPYLSTESLGQVQIMSFNSAFEHFTEMFKAGQDATMIVGTNDDRVSINKKFRKKEGYKEDEIMNGEQLISVATSGGPDIKTIVNGEQLTAQVTQQAPCTVTMYIAGKLKEEPAIWFRMNQEDRDVLVLTECKAASVIHKHIKDIKGNVPYMFLIDVYGNRAVNPAVVIAYFGYAITAHKAQGSQWENVFLMGSGYGDRARWLYTAITRASNSLTISSSANGVRKSWSDIVGNDSIVVSKPSKPAEKVKRSAVLLNTTEGDIKEMVMRINDTYDFNAEDLTVFCKIFDTAIIKVAKSMPHVKFVVSMGNEIAKTTARKAFNSGLKNVKGVTDTFNDAINKTRVYFAFLDGTPFDKKLNGVCTRTDRTVGDIKTLFKVTRK